jgi:ribA/ribD-fused uncharacterized protein
MTQPRRDPPIEGFFGEYRFLSNFHIAPIVWEGLTYPSTEHAYQAAKSLDVQERKRIAALATPKEARRAGQKIKLRPDWDRVKLEIMTEITRLKYQHPDLRERLLATGDSYLEETNWWRDRYWGTCEGTGQNQLGKLLMRIRREISQLG